MMYTVTFLNSTGGEVSTFVEADKIDFDPHWVSFRRNLPPIFTESPVSCDNCGRLASRPVHSRLNGSEVVAIYPAQRVRHVEETTRVESV